ncbi:hypothetical protein TRAPUB_13277 [Trametes pubescens]|uniref:Structure-specific endonuclease subunit SLX4 n=1 Tax=Trametes pubescens TaxID=154538 RepID=A0A1M2VRQ8_TRAPU|nr:hypothetical protein TRAPUB_13277 [Trametes pubescens]
MLAGPLLARSQSHFSQSSVPEYVEDSEPEREERRTKEKSRRKKKPPEVNIPSAEVIELTDSDASYHAGTVQRSSPKVQKGPIIVIDLSDSSDAALPRDGDATTDDSLPSIRDIFNFPQRAPQAGPSINADSHPAQESRYRERPARPTLQIDQPLSPSRAADSSGDDEDGSLKLGRFAYVAPIRRTASKTPSPTEGGSVPPDFPVATKAKGKAKGAAGHRFADDFSDAQLARVLKCVSCDLAWTTRKTVAQKMKHIQTCAKKNGLSDDTVRTLLQKELDSLPPVASTSKSATPAPAPEDAVPETLLEDLLKDAHKKKPGRRPQVLQTVKSVTDTRVTILDRARSLLQSEGPSRAISSVPQASGSMAAPEVEMPPATQVFSRSRVAAHEDRPPAADTTQLFGPSRLAGPSRLQGAIVRAGAEIAAQSDVSPLTQVPTGDLGGLSDSEQPPPSTQVFAQSKLTNVRGVTRRVVTASGSADVPDEPISIHDTSEDDFARPSSPPKPSDSRAPPSPRANASSPPRSRKTTSPRAGAAARRTPSPRPRRSPSPAGDGRVSPAAPAPRPDFDAPPEAHNDYDGPWNEWIRDDIWGEDDGACLHYVPEPEGAGAGVAGPSGTHASDESPSPPLASLRRQRLVAVLEDTPGPSAQVAEGPPEPAQKKRGRRKKAAAEASDAEGAEGKVADISQDELNAKMKEAVLADAALHLRILRYEPIHFDVFLQMAVALGMPAKRSGLKNKVRAFLDQK